MVIEFGINKERELVERLKSGDRAAFNILVEACRNRGFAVVYNLVRNPEDAKDVLQEAFIRVYLNINSFKGDSKFFTWFYRIAVNCAIDFLRKRRKREKIFIKAIIDDQGVGNLYPDFKYEPSRIILNKELSSVLDRCIADLPEKQRICFILKHQEGLSNQEISRILGCKLSTVKVHLFRAVSNLQKKFSFAYTPDI